MKNINIEKVKEVYNNTWRSYTEMQSNLPWFEDFRQEVETLKGYRGREILELLQNADDALNFCRKYTDRKICTSQSHT